MKIKNWLLVFTVISTALTGTVHGYVSESRKNRIKEVISVNKIPGYQGPKLTVVPYDIFKDIPRKKGEINTFAYQIDTENLVLTKGERYTLYTINAIGNVAIMKEYYVNNDLVIIEDGPDKRPLNKYIIGLSGMCTGEPSDFVLMSRNGKKAAACHLNPKPIESVIGTKKITAELVSADGSVYLVKGTGFEPIEEISLHSMSEGELLESTFKADDNGSFEMLMAPMVVGKRSGTARETFTTKKNEKFCLILLWGIDKLSGTRFE
jgi:hypothetical protein